MTKINRLSIHGFKSFANKVDVHFTDKFNCILGPNGSGKSNVSDAICFVLGRLSTKSLRAEKAANLIFNGGKNKKPSPHGTVEIVFDNHSKIFPKEEKEIVISRTITKNGTSIYRINGKKHTRTEILDLLASAHINPDGYNIILQGDINRFVDTPPTERRKIIESISDVSLYEEKKHKALLELNKVEDKLNNAEIVLKERKTYLRELKKDRDQAIKFKEFKDQIDSNKATYFHLQIKDKTKFKDQYDTLIRQEQEKISKIQQKIDAHKTLIQANKEKIASLNREIEQKGEKEQLKVHKDLEDIKIELTKKKERIFNLKDELTKITQRKLQLNEDQKEHDQKIQELNQQKQSLQQKLTQKQQEQKQIEEKINQFKIKNKLKDSQNLESQIEDLDKQLEHHQENTQKIRQKQQDLFREKDRLEFQIQTLDEKTKKVKEIEKENKDQIQNLKNNKQRFREITKKLNQTLDHDGNFASQISNARKKLQILQEQHAKLNAQNLTHQEKLFHNIAVRKILDQKIKGVHGTISQLGKVNKKYSPALESAAGAKTNFIVVENDKVAAECIKYLKQNKFGSASFIPLNKIKAHEISPQDKKLTKTAGTHNFAINLIDFNPRFQKAFQHVFGNTLVVDNINTTRQIGIGQIRMATLDGDLVEGSGVMRGGFRNKTAASFTEKDSEDNLKKTEASLGEQQSIISALEDRREANEKEISHLRNQRSELEADIIKTEKTLHLDTSDLDASQELKETLQKQLQETNQRLSQIQTEITQINKVFTELKTKRQFIKTEVSQLKDPRLLAQLSAFEESKNKFREDLTEFKTRIDATETQIEELILPEKNKIIDIIKQHDKEEIKFKEEITLLQQKIKNQETELKQKEKESVEFYSKYKQLFNQREILSNEITQKEEETEKHREKTRNAEIEINKISLKNAEVKAKLAALNEEFKQYQNTPLLKNKSEEELKKEINRFEVMLSQMSAVNMKALEIYERVETEFQKLLDKKQGLHVEKEDVMILMNEIETSKKDQFMKTFNIINKDFQRIFSMLFRKGDAHLELENPDQPFEEGLNVKVKLTGNRYMDIKSLSGGEKTLTALSFIFAIQEHQPASFYILDEIDAALDKHNSETLSKLIRSYSDKAQYLMISHNDSIISEADNLYGVSMQEGISKIISLKL